MSQSEIESHGSDRSSGRHEPLKNDGFVRRDQSWYVNGDTPSDLLVKVGDAGFHLHKHPMISRCGRMSRVIYDYETAASTVYVYVDPPDTAAAVVELGDVPGGADSFELAARFCYGMAVELTAGNISGLRCAAEYLEMTEDLEEGNLIFKTEAFLSYVVLSSWRDSIVALTACEGLSPWAEDLHIVRRCSDSVAWKACFANNNPRGGVGGGGGGRTTPRARAGGAAATSPRQWNWNLGGGGGDDDSKESSTPSRRQQQAPADWWFEDVSVLRIDHFVRVVAAIKVKGMRFDLIGASITHYASKWLPGLLTKDGALDEPHPQASASPGGGLHMIIASGGKDGDDIAARAPAREQRMVVESLISIIPPQRDSVSCGFLLRLLRRAIMLKAAPALVTELEKRVGMQLHHAVLPDLLIPSYGYGRAADTAAYDVDLVHRLAEHFLVQEQTETELLASLAASPGRGDGDGEQQQQPPPPGPPVPENTKGARVARLLDSYLSEVSRDRNLSLTKFQVLAESLPESARTWDDGLYRAVDSYLKAHPTLTEHERKRLCRVMDCGKLSPDACMHAAQNERLPLRVVVQVLFSEQLKISNALAATSSSHDAVSALLANNNAVAAAPPPPPQPTTRRQLLDRGTPMSFQEGWAAAKKDINTLKFEVEGIKAKYLVLEREMEALHRDKVVERGGRNNAGPSKAAGGGVGGKNQSLLGPSAWSSGWKKLGRLAKMTGGDGAGQDGHVPGLGTAGEAPTPRKPRRWRNSMS